ncbi:MAG: hypothetical protein PHT38_03845, partial [Halothiobacillus sp.]|nr:hypothetical protein [Halothiobacillus sp.]
PNKDQSRQIKHKIGANNRMMACWKIHRLVLCCLFLHGCHAGETVSKTDKGPVDYFTPFFMGENI